VRIRRWLPAFAWAVVIFVLCSIPGKDIPTQDWMQIISLDKLVHAGIFAVLMLFVLHGYGSSDLIKPLSQTSLLLLFSVIVYGGVTELYQHYFLPDRFADVYDFIANSFGAIIGLLIYHRYASGFYRRFYN